jgi:tRNA-dihydrouridine synthase B
MTDGVPVFLIGDVSIRAPVFLAPMSGVTDAPFRTQVMRFGAPAVVTEMVAGEELARESEEFVRRAAPHSGEGPFIVQLAGRDPHWMRVGAELAQAAGADIIDINMGCPAKRVTGGQAGCALMREPDLARQLVSATVSAFPGPVTVKMRLGWDESCLNAPDIARMAEGEGARLITVHGRTRVQFYTGAANWRAIARVVEAVTVPVIANGDIATPEEAREALEQSGAAGVMAGRGVLGRPWRLSEIAARISGASFLPPTPEARIASMLDQIRDSLALYGDRLGVRVVRKHVAAFIDAWADDHGLGSLEDLRKRLCQIDDPERLGADLLAGLDKARIAA